MAEHINYVSNEELCTIIRQNLYKVPHDIDGVICIPRSGLFVGTIIAEVFHKRMYTVESFLDNYKTIGQGKTEYGIPETNFCHYIVVDDSVQFGESFRIAREQLKELPYRFTYVACIGESFDMPNADIILSVVPQFRIFELNFFRLPLVGDCIFDIDGVLCENPEFGLDTNEGRYLNHLNNARPLIPLQYPAKAICTHRLTKYYEPTRQWLENHNISYEMLYMLNFPSIEYKMANHDAPEYKYFKTDVYNLYPNSLLFIESDYDEAMFIYQNTHRPVLCTDKNILIQD